VGDAVTNTMGGAHRARVSVSMGVTCGVLLGLAYLTRPGDAVYAVAIILCSLLWGRFRETAAVVAGIIVVLTPYWILNARINGSPFFTMYAVLSRTLFYGSAMYEGFGRSYPSTFPFLRSHLAEVSQEIARNWSLCLRLLGDRTGLGSILPILEAAAVASALLTAASPRALPRLRRVEWLPQFCAMALGGVLNLALSCLVWSSHEEARFVLGTWMLGLVLSLAALDHAGKSVKVLVLGHTGAGRAVAAGRPAGLPALFRSGVRTRDWCLRDPWPALLCLLLVLAASGLNTRADIRALVAGRKVQWVAADPGRMPDLRSGDDFSDAVRRDAENRDWRLVRLPQTAYLKLIPVGGSYRALRLYRVDQKLLRMAERAELPGENVR
ncbi:MAG: hypothetical protein LC772_11270, partial [Chloroflexi bacterium]|nr:hypothetical protein [Chloroflexota bacterium]